MSEVVDTGGTAYNVGGHTEGVVGNMVGDHTEEVVGNMVGDHTNGAADCTGSDRPDGEENVMLPNMPEGDPLEEKPDNYRRLTWFSCIVCSIWCNCCCGILAVKQSKKCDKSYDEGDVEEAGINSRQAYKFAIMAIICGSTFVSILIVTVILLICDAWQFPLTW